MGEYQKLYLYIIVGVQVFLGVTLLHMLILQVPREWITNSGDLHTYQYGLFVLGYIIMPFWVGFLFWLRYGSTLGLCMVVAVCIENLGRLLSPYRSGQMAMTLIFLSSVLFMAYIIYTGERNRKRNKHQPR